MTFCWTGCRRKIGTGGWAVVGPTCITGTGVQNGPFSQGKTWGGPVVQTWSTRGRGTFYHCNGWGGQQKKCGIRGEDVSIADSIFHLLFHTSKFTETESLPFLKVGSNRGLLLRLTDGGKYRCCASDGVNDYLNNNKILTFDVLLGS